MEASDGPGLIDGGREASHERLYDPAGAWSRDEMAGIGTLSFGLALLLHVGCVVGFVLLLGLKGPDLPQLAELPTADLVTQMPGEGGSGDGGGGKSGSDKSPSEQGLAGKSGTTPGAPPSAGSPAQTAKAETALAPAPLTDSAAPPTAPPPARTGDGPAATPPEAISQNRAPPPSGPAQPPADPAPSAGAPAADQKPPPAFVKPPEGPSEAATQKQRNDPANALTAPPADQPPPPPPAAAATPVLAAPEAAADAVPTGDQAKAAATATAAPSAQDKPPDATAQLQAALPMDLAGLPMSFRAVLSGPGAAPIIDYAGLVNDKLGQSVNALIGEAIRQHLKGQVVLSYSVGDAGQITVLQLVHSSGSAKLDQLALDMVRRSAPLPPPPAGAQRQFRKALMFGGQ